MGLKINHNLVNNDTANALVALCPFKAITYENFKLEINAACKNCKMCMGLGCPAISINDGKISIDASQCNGCTLCMNVCKFGAIKKVGEDNE